MARVSAGPATPKRASDDKEGKEGSERPTSTKPVAEEPDAWNANNSGWCIPKKGTADYDKVKNFHIRRRLGKQAHDVT